MKNKKMTKVLVGALLAGCVFGGWHYWQKDKLDPEYQEELDVIVWARELSGIEVRKKMTSSWSVYMQVPETLPREKWDAVHQQPQLMFLMNMPRSDLYTMNMNGTDIRMLVTAEELGGPADLRGPSRPARSPNGRYIAITYYAGMFSSGCALFDLKTREVTSLGDGRCLSYHWMEDSQNLYFKNIGEGLYHYNASNKELAKMQPKEGSGMEAINYDTQAGAFFITPDNELLIQILDSDLVEQSPEKGKEIVFRLKDMSYLGRQHYFAETCHGHSFSLDRKSFTCSFKGKLDNYYRIEEPNQVAGQSPQRWIIQEGKWFLSESGQIITRYRQSDEDSPLSALNYDYQVAENSPGQGELIGGFSLYLPLYLREGFNQRDWRPFFPPLPTTEQYQESMQRQLKQREKSNRG